MKIRTDIENIVGRYNVQVGPFDFSAAELEQLNAFGEPLVDIGGTFSGTLSRPGQTDTVLTVAGSHVVLAVLTPVILGGAISGVTVVNPGTGYGTATISITGDGTGAALTPLYGVYGGSIVGPGSGYLLNEITTFSAPNPIVIQITGVDGGGAVTSFSILSKGKLTAIDNTVGIVMVGGSGTGFTMDFTSNWCITDATVVSGGTGYNIVPTAVNFTLPSAGRRLMSDFPAKQIFDLRDSADSDIMAKVWGDTMVSRLTAAKTTLMSLTSDFQGETVVTV